MRTPVIRQHRLNTYLLLLAVLFPSSAVVNALSQVNPQAAQTRVGVTEPLRTAQASRVDRAPKLDGTLDDPLWQLATPITNLRQ